MIFLPSRHCPNWPRTTKPLFVPKQIRRLSSPSSRRCSSCKLSERTYILIVYHLRLHYKTLQICNIVAIAEFVWFKKKHVALSFKLEFVCVKYRMPFYPLLIIRLCHFTIFYRKKSRVFVVYFRLSHHIYKYIS